MLSVLGYTEIGTVGILWNWQDSIDVLEYSDMRVAG
jgi:hypothetical protein